MIFRQVQPNSTQNARNEEYEHFLIWLSPNGGVRQWLFSSTDGENETDRKGYDVETLENIRTVPEEKREMFMVTTKSLTRDEYNYVSSVLDSNRVYKVSKDGTKTPIGINQRKTTKPNQQKEFSVSFEFYYKESFILNV